MRPAAVMGVVNVTPDSFSDGGAWADPDAAIVHGVALHADGAAILDVGGESTRPGAEPVSAATELARVLPVVAGLRARLPAVRLSIDTSKADVARAALEAGADYVNDVTALRGDPDMAAVVAAAGARCCLVHARGEPRTMQDDPVYADVVDDVRAHLEGRVAAAVAAGVAEDRIDVDPGIGFGKTLEHNLALLGRLPELVALGRPVVVGASRKAFIGRLTGREEPRARTAGTLATTVLAFAAGARVVRVHDVAATVDALAVAAAVLGAGPPTTAAAGAGAELDPGCGDAPGTAAPRR